jgi:hypothetical protein
MIDEILKLIKETSNDMELGMKIRKLFNKYHTDKKDTNMDEWYIRKNK